MESWIESFVDYTENLGAPEIFRRWVAIGTIAAALEQRVWLTTSSIAWPNMYTILVGQPAVGKTRTIMIGRRFLEEIPEPKIAPTSLTKASLVDCLARSKRSIVRMNEEMIEYNTLTMLLDEWGAFMHEYDKQLVAGLTTFYDVNVPYGEERRGNELKVKIKRPQLNIIAGSTPTNLLQFMPEGAWSQGFTSRLMLIFSDELIVINDFDPKNRQQPIPATMFHDFKAISSLLGEFQVTQAYRDKAWEWIKAGLPPTPTHPKLMHYCARRKLHLFKLCMVSSVDYGDSLILTVDDFDRAKAWMLEAEELMPEIFKAGVSGADGKVMEELYHFALVADAGKGISEGQLVRFASERLPAHSVIRVIEIMERSGMISAVSVDKRTGMRNFRAVVAQH